MTVAEIKNRVKMTIDQYYHFPNRQYIEQNQLNFIGGVLQTALHLLEFDDYNEIKRYIYTTWGYDAGGCADGQIGFEDLKESEEE